MRHVQSISRILTATTMLLVVAVLVQSAAHAASYSWCSGVACEAGVRTGGTVTQWKATVNTSSGYHCRTARFWVNGGLLDQEQRCGVGDLTAYASTPYGLATGSQLCVSWVTEPGYPCIVL